MAFNKSSYSQFWQPALEGAIISSQKPHVRSGSHPVLIWKDMNQRSFPAKVFYEIELGGCSVADWVVAASDFGIRRIPTSAV
jgi:hypothetical protein